MTDINNNLPNLGINNINNKTGYPIKGTGEPEIHEAEQEKETKVVPDPGVLGRSMVKQTKGGNIQKSVDEAIAMMKNPEFMQAADGIFEAAYDEFIQQGMKADEAYAAALAFTSQLCA